MKPSIPSTPFVFVPGPDQTLNGATTPRSRSSNGPSSSEPVMTIRVVVPFADKTVVIASTSNSMPALQLDFMPHLPSRDGSASRMLAVAHREGHKRTRVPGELLTGLAPVQRA